jgi:RNA polymerase sigma factor (sigma-70 family)
MKHAGDPQLIEACRNGDEQAWDELIDRYGRLVYSIPRRYGLSEPDADDVHQAVFVSLYRNLDQLRDRSRLSSWLITTTHRECWRIGKRSGIPADLDDRIADVGAPSPEQAASWEQQHLVRVGLERLGGPCAVLLRALFLAGDRPDYQTIATQLDMKIGSIGPTRARCFKKLESILVDLGLDPSAGEEVSDPS